MQVVNSRFIAPRSFRIPACQVLTLGRFADTNPAGRRGKRVAAGVRFNLVIGLALRNLNSRGLAVYFPADLRRCFWDAGGRVAMKSASQKVRIDVGDRGTEN